MKDQIGIITLNNVSQPMSKDQILKLFLFVLLFGPFNLLAGWEVSIVHYTLDESKDASEISASFGHVPGARDFLLNFELTRPSKIQVTKGTVQVTYRDWKNVKGEECQVQYPEEYKQRRFEEASYTFHETGSPDQEYESFYMIAPIVHCNGLKKFDLDLSKSSIIAL